MKIIASTFEGLEPTLAEEIKNIGGSKIKILTRAVMYDGSRYTLYASNLFLRTALRIIVPIEEVEIDDMDSYYNQIKSIPWEDHFDIEQTFALKASITSKVLTHSKYALQRAKDAIVDRFREKTGERPSVDLGSPDFTIHIHVRGTTLTISLDSTGDSLHKRGYRQHTVAAPVNEVLAAGLLLSVGWDGSTPLHDPMCGSGTFLTEGFMISRGIPPHAPDQNFSFKNWKDFDQRIYDMVVEKEGEKLKKRSTTISGSDIYSEAVLASEINIGHVDKNNEVNISKRDFFISRPPEEPGMLIVNPPYDKRLRESDIIDFYKRMGDHLKKNYQGWKACILSGHVEALKSVGLRPSRRISVMNGAIPAKMFMFELYAGSKKRKY